MPSRMSVTVAGAGSPPGRPKSPAEERGTGGRDRWPGARWPERRTLPGSGGLRQDPAGRGRRTGAGSPRTATGSSSATSSLGAEAAATAGLSGQPPGSSCWTRRMRWRSEAAGAAAAAGPRRPEPDSQVAGLGLGAAQAPAGSLDLEAVRGRPRSPAGRSGLGCVAPARAAWDDRRHFADKKQGHRAGRGCTRPGGRPEADSGESRGPLERPPGHRRGPPCDSRTPRRCLQAAPTSRRCCRRDRPLPRAGGSPQEEPWDFLEACSLETDETVAEPASERAGETLLRRHQAPVGSDSGRAG